MEIYVQIQLLIIKLYQNKRYLRRQKNEGNIKTEQTGRNNNNM